MLSADRPALVLAPMEGVTDAPMRALMGATGAFSYAVSEFLRVSDVPLPAKVFRRDLPEFENGGVTPTGMPVQVQILGGHPERMALSALAAVKAGAKAIDINFGCPAPTVNRHDGGASLLRYPSRIREVVRAVRDAVPADLPVSAKLRLGWESIDDIYENARMAAEGGASWLTIHARTKMQGYTPPVYWKPIGRVREILDIPVIANGDIWTVDDFKLCQDQTGCRHYMLGRSALSNPALPSQIANELGLQTKLQSGEVDWVATMRQLVEYTEYYRESITPKTVLHLKQWAKMASKFGDFPYFDSVKTARDPEEFLALLAEAVAAHRLVPA